MPMVLVHIPTCLFVARRCDKGTYLIAWHGKLLCIGQVTKMQHSSLQLSCCSQATIFAPSRLSTKLFMPNSWTRTHTEEHVRRGEHPVPSIALVLARNTTRNDQRMGAWPMDTNSSLHHTHDTAGGSSSSIPALGAC